MDIQTLADLDNELNKLWRLGRNAIIGWCRNDTAIEILAVPQFLLSNLLSNKEDILADVSEFTRDRLYWLSDLCEIEPYRLHCPGLVGDTEGIAGVIRRYSVTLKKNKGVILLDTVGFSHHSPLDQVTLLNSLAYSINIGSKRALANGLEIELQHSTTGDGFYVWNSRDGFDANVDLFCVMMLILADNAIAREKSMEGKVPELRACYHLGNCFEYFQARGDRPSESSYIVGDATIDAARLIGKALPGQILVGNFVCPIAAGRQHQHAASVNTSKFIDIVAERLRRFEDVILSRDTIKSLMCYLTGERTERGNYNIMRYMIADKHGYRHEVFNAKINIHRSRTHSIYLGLRNEDLGEFEIVAKTAANFTPFGSHEFEETGEIGVERSDGDEPPKVLIVDDEPQIRELIADWLRERGFVPLEAESGSAARDALEENPNVRAVVTDVMLPGDMSGVDLARYVMKLGRQIRVIFVSGYPKETIMAGENAELQDAPFLMKPMKPEDFAAALESQLPQGERDRR